MSITFNPKLSFGTIITKEAKKRLVSDIYSTEVSLSDTPHKYGVSLDELREIRNYRKGKKDEPTLSYRCEPYGSSGYTVTIDKPKFPDKSYVIHRERMSPEGVKNCHEEIVNHKKEMEERPVEIALKNYKNSLKKVLLGDKDDKQAEKKYFTDLKKAIDVIAE